MVKACVNTMIKLGCIIVCQCCLLCGFEVTERDVTSSDCDSRLECFCPIRSELAKIKHSLESPPVFGLSILSIAKVINDPQVGMEVVKSFSINMVDYLSISNDASHYITMHPYHAYSARRIIDGSCGIGISMMVHSKPLELVESVEVFVIDDGKITLGERDLFHARSSNLESTMNIGAEEA